MTIPCESLSFSEAVSEITSMMSDQTTEGLTSVFNSVSTDKMAFAAGFQTKVYLINDIRQWGKDVSITYSWNASREHPSVEYVINGETSDGCFESQDDALFAAFENIVANP